MMKINHCLKTNLDSFRHGHSTEHARFELIEQISESFNSSNYFLGIFIALQKPLTQ